MCRSHRIGQTKTVHVYRLVSTGTMERCVYEQQVKKERLQNAVIDGNDDVARSTSTVSQTDAEENATVPLNSFLAPPAPADFTMHLDPASVDTGDDVVLQDCLKRAGCWLVR